MRNAFTRRLSTDAKQMLIGDAAILCDQRKREAALGLDELAPAPPRSHRRTQDYWIMLAGGNALIGAAMALGQFNAVSLVYGGSSAVLYSLGLTWIVWVVMDRY